MPQVPEAIIQEIFTASLRCFLEKEVQEILEGVNERNNCARWAMYLERAAHERGLVQYVADPEYNRKQDGRIKTILDGQHRVVAINSDLILHTRGVNIAEDNLIAIEVKKSDQPDRDKESDRERLRALTKASYDGIWMNDGSEPPEHVCGYRLGAFVELNRKNRLCSVEYFKDGEVVSRETLHF